MTSPAHHAYLPGLAITLLLGTIFCAVGEDRMIADMETKPNCTLYATKGNPKVSLDAVTVAQGKKSLRIEYDGDPEERATVEFPVEDPRGFDAIAFELYAEHDYGGALNVSLNEGGSAKESKARFVATLQLDRFIDGFETVRLVKEVGLEFAGDAGTEENWDDIRTVSLDLTCQKSGRVVFYVDAIRLEKAGGAAATANMLPNSSFEVATNPDTPDHWGRDLNLPPFGEDVWSVDTKQAHHGRSSLRIGRREKYARCRAQVAKGKDYTFSVYMKSNQEGTKAQLQISGVPRKTGKKEVIVGTDWQRFSVTATPTRSGTMVYAHLLSDAALWLDAAQLEQGTSPRPYAPSPMDAVAAQAGGEMEPAERHVDAENIEVRIEPTGKPPAVDGDLQDACWEQAQPMTPFKKISDKEEAASEQTTARICYDDRALYIAVRAEQSDMASVKRLLEQAGGSPWITDLVEVFIDLNHDRRTYYQFAVNANGDKWHARRTTKELFADAPTFWNAEWEVQGKIDAQGWTVEAAIPYTCFDLRPQVRIGTTIGLNVCRTSNPDPKDKPRREYSSWSFSPGGFEVPSAFGEVKGLDLDRSAYSYEVTSLDWQRDTACAHIRNATDADQHVTVTFCAGLADGAVQSAGIQTVIKKGRVAEVTAPLPLREAGMYRLFVRVSDASGHERLLSQSTNVRISGAEMFRLLGPEFDYYTKEDHARARCVVDASAERCKDLTLTWWLEAETGTTGSKSSLQPEPGVNTWKIPLSGLTETQYVLKAELHEKGKPAAEGKCPLRKLPPAPHEVRINRWGRFLVCDGKPFFWYGFYCSLNVSDDVTTAVLSEIKSANATAVLNYAGHEPNISHALDEAQRLGLKMWVHLQRFVTWPSPKNRYGFTAVTARAALTELVKKHRDHPALLGWCSIDEPGNRPTIFTREYVDAWYRLIKELDPYHPCIFSHLTRLGESEVYGQATDLALMPFTEAARYEHLFQEFWDLGLPVAVNAPCYDAGVRVHAPTPSEQRIRMYKALVLGACGLSTYTYRPTTMATWREFGRIGKELEVLAPVLLTPEERLRVDVQPVGGPVCALLKAHEGESYLLVVNTAPHAVDAELTLRGVARIGKAVPMFDSVTPLVDGESRRLSLSMPAQSTAVYRIEP